MFLGVGQAREEDVGSSVDTYTPESTDGSGERQRGGHRAGGGLTATSLRTMSRRDVLDLSHETRIREDTFVVFDKMEHGHLKLTLALSEPHRG
jgi:hypothetical protein